MKLNFKSLQNYIFISLITLWPIIHFTSINIGENIISVRVIYFGLFFCFLFLLLYRIKTIFLEEQVALSLVLSLVIAFFLFGSIEKLVFNFRSTIEYSAKIAIFFQFLLFLTLNYFFSKFLRKNNKFKLLTTLLVVLWVFPLLKIIHNFPQTQEFKFSKPMTINGNFVLKSNVYYIILDEYAREDVLMDYLSINNIEFIKKLKNMDFEYFPNSLSNYDTTPLSISTTLNMDYYTYNTNYDVDIIQNKSRILQILKEQGYKNIFVESGGNSQITCNGLEDYCIKSGTISDDIALLLQMTPLWRIMRSDKFYRYFEGIYLLTDLKKSTDRILQIIKKDNSSFFVFSHILSPHNPQRYNKDCSKFFSINPGLGTATKEQYSIDLPCLNADVISSVKSIIKQDKSDPIIFLTSDHGIARSMVDNNDEILRLKNLILIKSPKQCSKFYTKNLTPVNFMNFAISCLQDKNLPFKKNRHFVTIKGEKTQLVEVTDLVKEAELLDDK